MERPAFDPARFNTLNTRDGYEFQYLPSIGSTNLLAREQLKNGSVRERVIVADLQMAGRGRLGRNWEAPFASGLLCTLVFPLETGLDRAYLYSAALGLSVIKAAEELAGLKLLMKWPNDLLRDGRKIGGILGELELVKDRYWIVLGFGLNISLAEADFIEAGLAEKAANLTPDEQEPLRREDLLARVVDYFSGFRELLKTEPGKVSREWSASLVTLGQRVQVWQDGNLQLEGEAIRVEENGALVVRTNAGESRTVQAGDVSVRLPDGRYTA